MGVPFKQEGRKRWRGRHSREIRHEPGALLQRAHYVKVKCLPNRVLSGQAGLCAELQHLYAPTVQIRDLEITTFTLSSSPTAHHKCPTYIVKPDLLQIQYLYAKCLSHLLARTIIYVRINCQYGVYMTSWWKVARGQTSKGSFALMAKQGGVSENQT